MNRTNEICSALFVDFDNIFSSLKELTDQQTLDTFATQPDSWLEWLETNLSSDHFGDEIYTRRILIRKCYLNPVPYGKYRPFFTRAAFEVIDCPQLTSRGKTSTDMHMVMDIMDALRHQSNFDEFIIFSADADFTPILLRIRQFNRRSVVMAVGFSSPAYKSACDYLLPSNILLKQGLNMEEIDEEEELIPQSRKPGGADEKVLDRLADVITKALSIAGKVTPDELPPLYRQVPEFRGSKTWCDYYSLLALTRAVVARKPTLKFVKDTDENDWYVRFQETQKAQAAETSIPVKPVTANAARQGKRSREELLEEISKLVVEKVRQSPTPISMGIFADLIKNTFNSEIEGTGWLDSGSFSGLVGELDLEGLQIKKTGPGYIYDPVRHDFSSSSGIEYEFKNKYPEIEPIGKEIHQLTDMPYLLPEHYNHILKQLARTVNEEPFHMTKTQRLVRDRCVERGAPVARSHVNFVVNGIRFAGHTFGEKTETAEQLADMLYTNTLNLCQAAQMVLDEQQKQRIHEWLFCCLENPS